MEAKAVCLGCCPKMIAEAMVVRTLVGAMVVRRSIVLDDERDRSTGPSNERRTRLVADDEHIQ